MVNLVLTQHSPQEAARPPKRLNVRKGLERLFKPIRSNATSKEVCPVLACDCGQFDEKRQGV